ncbi:hypothetical protein ABZ806_42300, partial [Spirillospora sp. NPDC047418]
STNSPRPIQDASGKADFTIYLQGLSTPEVTTSHSFEGTYDQMLWVMYSLVRSRHAVASIVRPRPDETAGVVVSMTSRPAMTR